ncbi:unnamed protein product [Allacma fusca]|uniref:Uncharacterized protein n=1 Tax=Allacma fusca TaxID=39272 RepID=A0A8J2KTW1_9HEXA|nr:unnamed protein product [Allacma fusca]
MVLLLIISSHVGLGVYNVKVSKSERADQYAWSFAYFLYNLLGFWIFLHFYRHSSTLVQLVNSLSTLEIYFTQSDQYLLRDVSVVASIVMISAVDENICVNLQHVPAGPEDAGRSFLVSVTAARVNDRVRCVAELLRQCPDEFYNSEVQRTENFLNDNVIGLSGLGCFTITKPMKL